jgi:hypothetical protein
MSEGDEWTDAERRALASLPDESPVPPGFEDRVTAALRARGVVAGDRAARQPSFGAQGGGEPTPGAQGGRPTRDARDGESKHLAARRPDLPRRGVVRLGLAAAGLFGSGLGAGWLAARTSGTGPVEPGGPLYLLLLYPGARYEPGGPADEEARVAEYGAWAGRLRRAGQLVGAEKLKPGGRWLGDQDGEAAPGAPQGYFLVRARDDEEAEAIARACPHLRHGGRVGVQAIDPT